MDNMILEKLMDASVIIITGVILAIITYIVFDKRIIPYHKQFQEYGLQSFKNNAILSATEQRKMYRNAAIIKMCFVSGYAFFNNTRNLGLLKSALQKGVKVKLLIAKEGSRFVKEVDEIEILSGNRDKNTSISYEIKKLKEGILKDLCTYNNFSYRQYKTTFRNTFFYARKTNDEEIAYFNIFFPPVKSRDSKMLIAKGKQQSGYAESNYSIIHQISNHFDCAWKISKKS